MALPRLRNNLDIMMSPVADRPGVLIRDPFRYSEDTLIVPPALISSLAIFDGTRTEQDLEAELSRSLGGAEIGGAAGQLEEVSRSLISALSNAGFLEDETYARLKEARHKAFAESAVRLAAHAGSAYPASLEDLRKIMGRYLGGEGAESLVQEGLIGIAAPHISPEGGWQSYRAAYRTLTPELRDRTFIVLGTSHYGQPGKFGLTRKPYETPYGQTAVDEALVRELEAQPAATVEDYCHAVEHSIEFQVVFLQAIYGPGVRVVPILCGSFGRSVLEGGVPEDDAEVERFFAALGEIAEREKSRLFWVLGVDMAHMGLRYGDHFAARADQDEMVSVSERDAQRIERINASDAQGFWDLVKKGRPGEAGDDLKWCGSSPFYTFLKAVPQARGTLLRYEQWNIDDRSVVSFAGITFTA